MASSSNPRSSSSASNQKPTFRRASGSAGSSGASAAGRGQAARAGTARKTASTASGAPAAGRTDGQAAAAKKQPASYRVPSQRRQPGSLDRQQGARSAGGPSGAGRTGVTGRASVSTGDRASAPGDRPATPAASRPRAYQSVPATRSDAGARKGRGKRSGRARETATGLISRVPVPRGRGAGVSGAAKVLLGVVAGVLVLVIALILVFNSGVFKIKTIEVNGSEHVSQATVEQLVDVPEGTTYFNVDEDAILASLQKIAWVADVDIQKTFPSTISITPVEHEVALLVYSNTDDVAWLVSAAGTWISPVSLVAAVDEDGDAVEQLEDGTWPEGATELSGEEAALAVAATYGALLVTDIPSSVEPSAGSEVDSDEVEAALAYVQGFSEEFLAQIKSLSAASVESLAAILTSGVEVALGPAEDIETKEQVITTLLEEQEGVTYINVREADAYTFRSTPTSE